MYVPHSGRERRVDPTSPEQLSHYILAAEVQCLVPVHRFVLA